MGLFGRKNKIALSQTMGSEAGDLAMAQLAIPFALTKYMQGKTFTAPSGFYDDLYIKGYAVSFVTTMADVGSASLGKRWTEPNKQKFVMSAFEGLVGKTEVAKFISGIRAASSDTQYRLGSLHANTQLKLQFAPSGIDLTLPMFEEAVAIAEKSDLYSVDTAFNKVTLRRHIEEEYLS